MIRGGRKLRTYAFVDASNIIYGAKTEGWFIDQKKLITYLKKKFSISKAFFYYGKDSKNKKQEKFLHKLREFGYTLRVKEIKRYRQKTKANCDVDLTLDLLIQMDKYKRAIVLSGDGDFLPVYQYLQKKRKKIVIISSPHRTAREIREFTGENFINLGNLKYFLKRE